MEPATWMAHEPHLLRFDVCNGDADGLCAVRQWRLHEPAPSTLITGLKREIELLQRVPVESAGEVLVCDISLARNRVALQRLLDAGARVRYFDHHALGTDVPAHAGLEAHLDPDRGICTSLLMDRHLGGRFRAWALAGAYGDNLSDVADTLAETSGFDAGQRVALRRLGEAINYNAYGDSERDVCIAPIRMYALMSRHADPLQMWAAEPVLRQVEQQRAADFAAASALAPYWEDERARVFVAPDAPWSRRVLGAWANHLANARPAQAQAVAKVRDDGAFELSVRAPRGAADGAHALCAAFGGGGRQAAGGIDHLPHGELDRFVEALRAAWDARAPD